MSSLPDAQHHLNVNGSLDGSFEAFLGYSFQSRNTSRLAVAQDTYGRFVLRVIDWSTMSLFERIEYSLSGAATLPRVVEFVQNYLITNSQNATSREQFQKQCELLRKKVKQHNRGFVVFPIDFALPYPKRLLIMNVTLPVVPTSLKSGISLETKEIAINYTETSTFAKVEKILAQWERYCPVPTGESRPLIRSLAQNATLIADWVRRNPSSPLTVVYDDIDLKKYVEVEAGWNNLSCYQSGYYDGVMSRQRF